MKSDVVWQLAVAGVSPDNLRGALRMYSPQVRIMSPEDPVMVVVAEAGARLSEEEMRKMHPGARFGFTKEQLEAELGFGPSVRTGTPACDGKTYGSSNTGTYTPPKTRLRSGW